MQCPKCQSENPATRKFCRKCGSKLILLCPQCSCENLPADRFCGECGHKLDFSSAEEKPIPEAESERKHVTVLFSDLSGYTTMTEKLDPEEVKEIHGMVEHISPQLEAKVGRPLSMHSGINTGLVVTGEVKLDQGTHGLTGDAINTASRLQGIAKAGEILVGYETYRQTEGYFDFEELEATKVKGKTEPVSIYRMISPKDTPVTVHRLSGLRAEIIGRSVEMIQLREAVDKLQDGKGSIFSICGDAGTGKSRLVEEFKAILDLKEIQWLEGHAYAHAQNIPYFPLVDLLARAFEIEEGDPSEEVRDKVESGIEGLLRKTGDIVPYVGSLYGLSYPEIEKVSPEFWKSRLHDGIQSVLSALAQKASTVFCLENLHWADPSSIELLREALFQVRQPAIVLCVYRPEFSLFRSHQSGTIGEMYQEIRLKDLSTSEAHDMLESLLKTETIPSDLKRFVQDKAEGNPLYLEELVNSLIESEVLARDNGRWRVTRSIGEAEISSTIHGIITGRLDRLERGTKRILQEASVIGRAFLYEILKRVTELKHEIDRCLRGLEQLDLIRARSLQPDLEYVFKHALTQEVVYNGLLKKERKEIHERIGIVMEQLFQHRLPEFYEALAFHFSKGLSARKAVYYLVKSAEKSAGRYALEESHQFFKNAFELIGNEPDYLAENKSFLIDFLIKWAYVFSYRGDFGGLIDLFRKNEELAESLGAQERLGMYYAWLGLALQSRERLKDAYYYLQRSLKIGEEIESHKVIGYACTHLTRTCSDMGLLEEAVAYGKKALEMSKLLPLDPDLFRLSLSACAGAYYFRGESKKTAEVAKILLEHGERQNDTRCISWSYLYLGLGRLASGDIQAAIEQFNRTIQVSVDPFLSYWARFLLSTSYVMGDRLEEAANTAEEVIKFSKEFGSEILGTSAKGLFCTFLLAKGNLDEGLRVAEEVMQVYYQNGSMYRMATAHLMQGQVYLRLIQRAGPKSFTFLFRNIGFLLKNVPLAQKKAEDHFNKAIEVAKEIGAKGVLGQAYLGLGLLRKAKKRKEKSQESFLRAIRIFEEIEADGFLEQSKEALNSLG